MATITNGTWLRHLALASAVALFLGGLVWALTSTPDLLSRINLAPLPLLVLIGAPVAVVLNAIELHGTCRLSGAPMKWRTAVEVTVYTNAANMLPLPGGMITRIAAMKAHGLDLRTGSSLTVLSFGLWGGTAFLYASAALFWLGPALLGVAFAAVGAAALAGCILAFASKGHWQLLRFILVLKLVALPIMTARTMLAMAAVGASIGVVQAAIFVVAPIVGSAVSIVPAGLGVNETVFALLSPAVHVEPQIGLVSAAIGRVAWMAGLIITGLLLLVGFRQPTRLGTGD
jgi:hypothetical protein